MTATAPANGRTKRGRNAKPVDLFDGEPAQDLRAEMGVLACIMVDSSKIDELAELQADDFHSPYCRRVFEAMRQLKAEGKPAGDSLLLHDRLVASLALSDVGVAAFLAEIADTEATAHNAAYYVRLILQKSQQRAIREAGARFIQLAADDLRASRSYGDWLAEVKEVAAAATTSRLLPAMNQKPDELIDAVDLMALEIPETRWAIDGIICEGLTILASVPKFGKSWLMMHLGMSIAAGGYALGKIKVEQGRVLALCLEDTRKRLQSRLARMASADGGKIARGLVATTTWKKVEEGGIEAIEADLIAHPETRLVIVDTLQKLRAKGARNGDRYAEDYDSIARLKALADKYRVAIVVIHHVRKGRGVDPLEEVSGTMGLTGAADSILVAKRERGRKDASLFLTGRDVEEREIPLAWDAAHCLWSIVGDGSPTAELSHERQEIINTLRVNIPSRLGPLEVAELLGKNYATTRWLMAQMGKDGLIFGDSEGKYTVQSA